MKKVIGLLSFVILVCIPDAQAQNTPLVDQRQKLQTQRIREGVASGELTHREVVDARHDQRRIRRVERRAKADGVVTTEERARLHRKQNQTKREIRRDKHDRQDRPRSA